MRKAFGMMLLAIGASAVASAAVPEIDPASASSALALIAGGLLVMGARRKK